MSQDVEEMEKLWTTMENLDAYIEECKAELWSEMVLDDLDDGAKKQVKKLRPFTNACAGARLTNWPTRSPRIS